MDPITAVGVGISLDIVRLLATPEGMRALWSMTAFGLVIGFMVWLWLVDGRAIFDRFP